jgi:DNA-binding response OmpR family regulator
MPSEEPHRAVLSQAARPGASRRDADDTRDDSPSRRLAGAHTVLLAGQSLADNASLIAKLEEHPYPVLRHRSVREAPIVLQRDPAAIALLEARVPRQAETLEVVRRLDPRARRRVLVLVWRPAGRAVRQFIEAGAGDFLTLPAPASEVLLRLELRAREARLSIFAEPNPRAELPAVNHLSGAIGPETGGVRLSDREFLLYDMLAQRFGTVVSRAEILSRIWGRGLGGEPTSNIVDVYVRYLRVKLAKVAPSLVITTVRQVGYVLERREE